MEVFRRWGILMMLLSLIIICSLAVAGENTQSREQSDTEIMSHEHQIIKMLLDKYARIGTYGRPVKNVATAVNVSFGLGLINMAIGEQENMLTISVWTRYMWKDEFLIWDPSEYGHISNVRLPKDKTWTPDIMLYNTASTEHLERDALMVVDSNGMITWSPHRIFECSCAIDVRNFPFDNQICHLWFGSWTYSGDLLGLEFAFDHGLDISTYASDFRYSSMWEITEVKSERKMINTFPVLCVTLSLKRRMIFSSYILTFPAVFLSFLTLLVFWLPAGHSDKASLGLAIFGNLLLLLLILVEAAPPTAAGVPLLGLYYCFNIILVLLSIFLSSLCIKVGHREDNKRVPGILRKLFLNKAVVKMLCSPLVTVTTESDGLDAVLPGLQCSFSSATCSSGNNQEPVLMNSSDMMVHYLTCHKEKVDREGQLGDIKAEWRSLANILDRIFLILFLVVIIVSASILFPRYNT